jgi:hypothetical protein
MHALRALRSIGGQHLGTGGAAAEATTQRTQPRPAPTTRPILLFLSYSRCTVLFMGASVLDRGDRWQFPAADAPVAARPFAIFTEIGASEANSMPRRAAQGSK